MGILKPIQLLLLGLLTIVVAIATAILVIVSIAARLIVIILDIIFMPRIREETLPWFGVQRNFFYYCSTFFASEKSLEVQQAASELEDLIGERDALVEGYAIRKTVGQTIDYVANIIFFAVLALFIGGDTFGNGLSELSDRTGIPSWLVIYMLASLTSILALISMIFGPFYGLFNESKKFCLRKGAYRAAKIYARLEGIVSIPLFFTNSGFTLLDIPPVSPETYGHFKEDFANQVGEVKERLTELVGNDPSKIPGDAQNLIRNILEGTEKDLGELDLRDIQVGVARDFSLLFYNVEESVLFSGKKEGLKIFAEMNNLSIEDAEDVVREIVSKVESEDIPLDFLNSVLITGALIGISDREEKYLEVLEDLEINQVSVALALGALQYIKDFYSTHAWYIELFEIIRSLFYFFIAIPYVILSAVITWIVYMIRYTLWQVTKSPIRRFVNFIDTRSVDIHDKIWEILHMLYAIIKEKRVRESLAKVLAIAKEIMVPIIKIPYYLLVALKSLGKAVMRKLGRGNKEANSENQFKKDIAIYSLGYMLDQAYQRCILETPLYY